MEGYIWKHDSVLAVLAETPERERYQEAGKEEQRPVKFANFLKDLFVSGLSSNSRILHSNGSVTITGEGLHILTYARHSWLLSSEGSFVCHT